MARNKDSEAVQLAKLERDSNREKMVLEVITHPILLAIVGYYLSDRLQGDYVEGRLKDKPRVWSPTAGKLQGGAALAMQAGMTAYLGAEAVKSISGAATGIFGR